MLRGKRGSPADLIIFPIKMLVTVVLLLLVGFIMVRFGTEVQGTPINDTEVGHKSTVFMQQIGNENISQYFVLLFAFDMLGIIGTSFLVTLSPFFLIIYIIFMAFAVCISAFSMIFYDRISEVSMLATFIQDHTIMNTIMQYAPIISLVVGALSAIIIMAKPSGGGAP